MGKVVIVCPECSQRLSFNEVPGYQNLIVQCPKCKFKANVSVYRSGSAATGGQGADDSPTVLIGQNAAPGTDAGQIRVLTTGEVQWLKPGSNVIGRRAATGTADIQISNDRFMSRRHVQIDVVPRNGGFAHHLVEINSKNAVRLNGRPVGRGDVLVLKYGDKIILGATEIILEGRPNAASTPPPPVADNDQTLIR